MKNVLFPQYGRHGNSQEKEQDYDIMQKKLKMSIPSAVGDGEAVRPRPVGHSPCPCPRTCGDTVHAPVPHQRELLTQGQSCKGIQGVFEPEVPFPITPQQVR